VTFSWLWERNCPGKIFWELTSRGIFQVVKLVCRNVLEECLGIDFPGENVQENVRAFSREYFPRDWHEGMSRAWLTDRQTDSF